MTTQTPALSPADIAAHDAGTHYRLPVRVPAAPSTVPSVAELTVTTEIAYLERDRQLAEQVNFELAAGGLR